MLAVPMNTEATVVRESRREESMIILVVGLAVVVIAFVIAVVVNMRLGRNWEPKQGYSASGDALSDLSPPPPSAGTRNSDKDETTTTEQ